MKSWTALLAVVLGLGAIARADGATPTPTPNPNLSLQTNQNQVYMFNQAPTSCRTQILNPSANPDGAGAKLEFGQLLLTWTGNANLQLDYMQVSIAASSVLNAQTYTFSGQDMSYIWRGSPGLIELMPQPTAYTTAPTCDFEVGGMVLKDPSQGASGTGTVTVYGSTLINGVSQVVSAQATFTYTLVQ